ncbi:MAG: class I SAM-dependent methyltransferase [Candidatus Hodarchaeota archaeon]
MKSEERQEILSRYRHIFESEKEYYSKTSFSSRGDFDLESEDFFRKANLQIKENLGTVKNKKILDIGCGTGALSFYLANKGANVTGIDLSETSINICKKEAERKGFTIDFKEMNAQILDFEEESFDIIVGSRVIHHLPDLELFFIECRRILKKKGYIVFIEPLKKNKIVELNRKYIAPEKRTIHEHPLFFSDLMIPKRIFGNLEHSEYFLLSPLAMFFRDFLRNNKLFTAFYKILNIIEAPLTKIDFLKQYCWQTVFKCVKI